MGFGSTLKPFAEGGINVLQNWGWVLWIFVPIALLIFSGFMYKMFRDKKKQWTHKLGVRKELTNGELSAEVEVRMMRYPLIRTAEIFRLENPILGSYLFPELPSYTSLNKFNIIIGLDNRIYISNKEYFDKEKSCTMIAAKHAEIDITLGDLKKDYQQVHKIAKTIEWGQIAKFALLGILIIGFMVVGIKGIEQWGKNHEADAQKASAEAVMYEKQAEAWANMEEFENIQLILIDEIKELKKTENIQSIINKNKK